MLLVTSREMVRLTTTTAATEEFHARHLHVRRRTGVGVGVSVELTLHPRESHPTRGPSCASSAARLAVVL